MQNLIARFIQLNDLPDNRILDLHAFEKSLGRYLSPHEIFYNIPLKERGSIPEEIYKPVESKLFRIYDDICLKYQNDLVIDDLSVLHETDFVARREIVKIEKDKLSSSGKKRLRDEKMDDD